MAGGKGSSDPLLDKDGKPNGEAEGASAADDNVMKGAAGVVKRERPPEMQSIKEQ